MTNIPSINFNKVIDKGNTLFNQTEFYEGNFDKINQQLVVKVNELDTQAGLLDADLGNAEGRLDLAETDLDTLELNKVDKVPGKVLSTNDYTTEEKAKVTNTPLNTVADLGNKVDKVTGKGLSANDYTTEEKNKVTNLPLDTLAQLGEIANGTGINNGVIIPEKTSFANLVIKSLNIFNKLGGMTDGFSVDRVTGLPYIKAGFSISYYIKVKPSTTYTAYRIEQYAGYDANKVFVAGGFTKTFTTSPTTEYIRIGISNAYIDTEMIVEGTVLPVAYVTYDERINITDFNYDENLISDVFFDSNELKDIYKVSGKNASFLVRESINLFDKDTVVLDKRLASTNFIVDDVNNTISDYIEVSPETIYSTTEANGTHFYDANKVFISGVNTMSTFTTPALTKYVRITARKIKLDVYMMILGSIKPLDTDYKPYYLFKFGSSIVVDTTPKKFEGKIWNVMGDSITSPIDSYWAKLKAPLGIAKVNNYGEGGTAIAVRPAPNDLNAMCIRYTAMDDNADLITVLGGTNDFSVSVPLGVMSDRVTDTFYGACHTLFGGLVTKYPTKTIVGFTTIPRYNMQSIVNGKTVFDFADAMIEVCGFYGIPCFDLLRYSQFRPYNETNKIAYIPDGLHPNEAGKQLMANQMLPLLSGL